MASTEKKLGDAPDVSMEDFLRTLLGQMFENDNDTSYLTTKLAATDGSESDIEFMVRLTAVNGVRVRDDEDDEETE